MHLKRSTGSSPVMSASSSTTSARSIAGRGGDRQSADKGAPQLQQKHAGETGRSETAASHRLPHPGRLPRTRNPRAGRACQSCPPRGPIRPRGATRRGCRPADASWTAAAEPCPVLQHEALCRHLLPPQDASPCRHQRSLLRHDAGQEAQRTRRRLCRCPACADGAAREQQREVRSRVTR